MEIGDRKLLNKIYNKEAIQNVASLGEILREIRARLIREGVSINEARLEFLDKNSN